MRNGRFDDARKEYVIEDPRTPVKWINYVGTLAFGGFVDHTGGSQLCSGDPALERITKYIPQTPSSDFKGETAYLRVRRPGAAASEAKLVAPYWLPTLDPQAKYECRVGLGYNRWTVESNGVRIETTVFVPRADGSDAGRLYRDYRVTNLGSSPIRAELVPVVEFSHFDALKQLTNADWVPQTMQTRAKKLQDGRTALVQYAFMKRETAVNVLVASLPATSWETDRERFLGENGYGSWAIPRALAAEELSSIDAYRGNVIAALLLPLGDIAPGATARVVTELFRARGVAAVDEASGRYADAKSAKKAMEERADFSFAELSAWWTKKLQVLSVKTPDPALDSMVNVHNPRQCLTTKDWSRYLSFYQLGYGSDRGIGFRDSSQDCMGVLPLDADGARSLMEKLLSVQRRNGSAYHQFNPLTMEAGVGDSKEYEDRPKYYGDDHLWIVLAVTAYLKETGDYGFLEKSIPFYDKDKAGNSLEAGSVLEHLKRAILFTFEDTGAHGLPLLGFADWNDTVNLPTGAESLFNANLYGVALKELAELFDFRGDGNEATNCRAKYAEMKSIVEQTAWDGEWFVRWFDHDGKPVGSKTNEKGKIWLNGQSWPVLSGFAGDKARAAMDAVEKYLATPKGIKLSAPGYDGFDPTKGGVTTYPSGAKENGGIFLHPNPWAVIAETMLGDGDRAHSYYARVNPATRNDHIEEYECEPYCYAQNILADEHPQFGLGRNSWLSGTASWMYQASTKYILGIRPEYAGLRIDPCVPKLWDGFTARRTARGATYEITVRNPRGVSKGVSSLVVDGKKIEGNVVPWFTDGAVHRVEAELGA
jgi:cellobiose phosphorylase